MEAAEVVGSDFKKCNVIISMMLGANLREQQLASATYYYVINNNPNWMTKHLKRVVEHIINNNTHVGLRRNYLRVLAENPIAQDYMGPLFDFNLNLLLDHSEGVGVRAYAMTILQKICYFEPELSREVILGIKEAMKCGYPAVTGRGAKIIRDLEKRI